MFTRETELHRLEELYKHPDNGIAVVYGRMDCEKEQLLMQFTDHKKKFYYRCRQASPDWQRMMMAKEVASVFDVHLSQNTYDECFNRVKSGDPSKLVIIIDEFQFALKKDPELWESILRLKNKKLYPGPVLILLCSSSVAFVEHELQDALGERAYHKIDHVMKINDLSFLEVVRMFPSYQVSECIKVYGILGGVAGYLKQWYPSVSLKQNICRLVLSPDGYLFQKAEQLISSELRELSVYNTILAAIAAGNHKLNDLYHVTGFSRAKISVYMKNLAAFDVVEKVVPFETGGWDNAKKGIYQIKDTYINFWYRFVYPHLSDLYCMKPDKFYDVYIREELDSYLNHCFLNVCKEYLVLLGRIGKTPIPIHKIGSWIGKTGNVDIVAQDKVRNTVVGLCNWEQKEVTVEMLTQLFANMKKAKIKAVHFYVFSARGFSDEIKEIAKEDPRLELVDMNEL